MLKMASGALIQSSQAGQYSGPILASMGGVKKIQNDG
jgi:hypothetical protein